MPKLAREAFEATLAPSMLTRNGDDYSDPRTNYDWKVWQLAWLAALHYESVPARSCRSIRELTEEELSFINSIFL